MCASDSPIDVLATPLFTVAPDHCQLTLAGLLARLLQGPEVESFAQLAPEQRSYWWRFLVRCAAKALHELGWSVARATTAPGLDTALREALAAHVPAGGWRLHQPDPAQPGFLQCPTPDGLAPDAPRARYELRGISLLTGALGKKNHERKADAVRSLSPEQAVYALIEYQTAAIYGGQGNYGSQLQGSASGAGSGTPFMGARLANSNCQTFQHDVQLVLDRWPQAAQLLAGAVWALWGSKWSGEKGSGGTPLDLEPAFIPLARLVRLGRPSQDRFSDVWFRPTSDKRIADETGGSCFGDPFTPLVRDPKLKIRGTLEKGYDYAEVVQLLFGGGDKGASPSPSVQALVALGQSERTDLSVLFEGTAYEQGKTAGFHRREVPLPAQGGISWLSQPAPLRRVHALLLKLVGEAKSALRGAARIVLSGDPRPRPHDARKVEAPAALLEARIDQVYLDFLFGATAQLEAEGDTARFELPLLDWLGSEARAALRGGLDSLPCNTNERLAREVRAEAFLSARLRKLRGEDPAPVAAAVPAAKEAT